MFVSHLARYQGGCSWTFTQVGTLAFFSSVGKLYTVAQPPPARGKGCSGVMAARLSAHGPLQEMSEMEKNVGQGKKKMCLEGKVECCLSEQTNLLVQG